MKGTPGAFRFLIGRTLRNRLARQLGRLKSPRYAAAAVVGVLYVVLVFLRPAGSAPTPGVGVRPVVGTVGGLGFAITVLIWWLGGGVTGALAFQPAEVQLLFPAPVSRRQLLGYKLVRTQLLLLINCVIWMLLSRNWGVTIAAPLRFLTIWGFFTVFSLHRLGAALVMTPPVTGGRWVARALAKGLAAAATVALVVGVGPALLRFGSVGFQEGIRAVGNALAAPPASWALAPFRLVLAPLYATSPAEWLTAFAVVLGIVALHLAWVLGIRVAFEEVAATVSADVAKRVAAFKERRAGGAAVMRPGKPVREWLPLKPVGPPAVAIAWKNTVALMRTGMLRSAILIVAIVVVMSQATASAGGRRSAASAIPFVTLAVMAFILGPRMVRNDLRQDLLSLASIKSYPLRGTAVVAAEMASPTLVLTLFQLAMLAAAWFTLPPAARNEVERGTAVALVLVTPFLLLAVNALSVGIQNAAALLFPGWVRLGADSGGIEAIGQTLLVTLGSMLVLLLALVIPAVAGIGLYFIMLPALGGLGLVVAGLAGLSVLVFETVFLVRSLGGVFERTEPTAIG